MNCRLKLRKHEWLLQAAQPVSFYAENDMPAESWYYYECQRCGVLERQKVTNLDNAPGDF